MTNGRPQSDEPKKKKKSNPWPIIIVIVVVLLGVLAFFLYRRRNTKKVTWADQQQPPQPITQPPLPPPIPASEHDPTLPSKATTEACEGMAKQYSIDGVLQGEHALCTSAFPCYNLKEGKCYNLLGNSITLRDIEGAQRYYRAVH